MCRDCLKTVIKFGMKKVRKVVRKVVRKCSKNVRKIVQNLLDRDCPMIIGSKNICSLT